MGLEADGIIGELHGGLGVEEDGEEDVEDNAADGEAHREPLQRLQRLFIIKHCSVKNIDKSFICRFGITLARCRNLANNFRCAQIR